jgi:glutaredoxin
VRADVGRPGGVYRAAMPIRLHRCSKTWLHLSIEPCWKVQRELDRQGIAYEIVEHPNARWNRDAIERLSGQTLLPVIELEDGTVYREESKDMAARIRAGRLFEPSGEG